MSKLFYCSLFLLVSFSSCSFHRRVAGKMARSIEKDSLTSIKDTVTHTNLFENSILEKTDTSNINHALIEMLTPVWKNRLNYNTFSGKARIHYDGNDESQEFTANFRIRKDSVIWIAITAMGGMVQAARVCITLDSFILIDYLQKQLICLPLRQIAKILPTEVDFTSIQNLILGEPVRTGAILNAGSFGGLWSLKIKDNNYFQNIDYSKDDTTMVSAEIETINKTGTKAMMQYGEYENTDQKKISTKRVMNIQALNAIYSVDVKFINFYFDQTLEYPFNIPKNYTKKQF